MPARSAITDDIIQIGQRVLDYGSGRGQDVQRLRLMGIDAVGWDPYFDDHAGPIATEVVLLTYVLNVIEDPAERNDTLADAWRNATRTLVVSTRLSWEARRVRGEKHSDGIVTSRQTFQHLFQPNELRSYVENITGVRCVSASPGVVYAFRDAADRLSFIARRALPRFDWQSFSDHQTALAAVVDFAERRGRAPTFEEIPTDALPILGRISSRELARLVIKAADDQLVADAARRATLDCLLYLGIDLFNGRAPRSALPQTIQGDLRAHFSSYREACQRSERLLTKLRDSSYIRGAMRNSVGKMTPTALYVHKRASSAMPVILRLYEHCGAVAAGRPAEYTIIKLSHDRRAVAWLGYPDFDVDPHPRTAWSYRVTFPDLVASYDSFGDRSNRPLLHRKEEFLAQDDPQKAKYERLTRAEVVAGLYSDPSTIGTEDGWQRALDAAGVSLRGHRLIRNPSSAEDQR